VEKSDGPLTETIVHMVLKVLNRSRLFPWGKVIAGVDVKWNKKKQERLENHW